MRTALQAVFKVLRAETASRHHRSCAKSFAEMVERKFTLAVVGKGGHFLAGRFELVKSRFDEMALSGTGY